MKGVEQSVASRNMGIEDLKNPGLRTAMEDNSSTANPNPSQPIAMSPSKSVQSEANPEPETPEPHAPIRESSDPLPEKSDQESQEEIPEEGEEEECGFCLFMKGGGCRDPFTEWEKCVEEGEKNKEDIVEKCFEVTSTLKKCMEAHSGYYAPILQAEKAAEAEALKELEMEKEKVDESNSESGSTKSFEFGGLDFIYYLY
nr:transcription elongation factor spt5 [Ipomoea batatas]